jgi:copper transport protein
MPVTQAPPAVALLVPGPGTWLVSALMAVDRLVVLTGLLVLLGGAGLVAVARLPTPAWRLTRRMEGRAWWLLRVAWWATLVGTLVGLLLHGPFTAGLPLRRALDATLLAQTVGTRFGGIWAVRVLLLLFLVAFLRAWSQERCVGTHQRLGGGRGAGGCAGRHPALSGHAAAGPYAAVGAVLGALHFSAAAVWFGGLVLLGTCVLPNADVELLAAVPRFSAVAFTAMVVIIVTGTLQGWRQLGSLQAVGDTGYGHLLLAKVAVFVVLIAVAARSRVLVRRKLTARALAGAAAPHRPARAAALPRLAGDDADAGSLSLLRRLVLAEITIAIVVLVITALLGIATPPIAA